MFIGPQNNRHYNNILTNTNHRYCLTPAGVLLISVNAKKKMSDNIVFYLALFDACSNNMSDIRGF